MSPMMRLLVIGGTTVLARLVFRRALGCLVIVIALVMATVMLGVAVARAEERVVLDSSELSPAVSCTLQPKARGEVWQIERILTLPQPDTALEVLLAGSPDGEAPLAVDDVLSVELQGFDWVYRLEYSFQSSDRTRIEPHGPLDLSREVGAGEVRILVRIIDKMPPDCGTATPIYLVVRGPHVTGASATADAGPVDTGPHLGPDAAQGKLAATASLTDVPSAGALAQRAEAPRTQDDTRPPSVEAQPPSPLQDLPILTPVTGIGWVGWMLFGGVGIALLLAMMCLRVLHQRAAYNLARAMLEEARRQATRSSQ